MAFQKKRFYYEADEANFIRLQLAIGKPYFQQKDFQQLVSTILTKIAEGKL